MDGKSISFRAFESGPDESDVSRRVDLPVLSEVLTQSDPPEFIGGVQAAASRSGAWPDDPDVDIDLDRFTSRADPSGWTCSTDSVRAQLESVINGRPPPLSSSRFQHLRLVAPVNTAAPAPAPASMFMRAPRVRAAAPAGTDAEGAAPTASDSITTAPPTHAPTPAIAVADATSDRVAEKAERAAQVARAMLADQKQHFARLDAERAQQIEELTRRAEAAQAQVRELEAHIAAEQQLAGALGRRFGQQPHELFLTFVARLGMMAKAAVPRGGRER